MKKNNKNKNLMLKGYIYCLFSYAIAFFVAVLVGVIFRFLHPLIMIFLADLAATLVIFAISSILKNTSFYDPYWSVAPLIITLYYLIFPSVSNYGNTRSIIVSILIFIWSIRLTFNWLRQWQGLRHEDWRYMNYRQKMGRKFWMINLIGLQLMPTILVYLGSVSLYPILSLSGELFGFIDIIAIIVTVMAILFETIADQQLYVFMKTRENTQVTIVEGLWAYSRHPNYFGEILFWWGIYLFAIAANISFYWAIIGPILITILFNTISIPLMERRNSLRKPDYQDYKKRVSRLIPWFPKKKN